MIRRIIRINSVIVVLLATCLFIYPPIRAYLDIQDPALRQPGIPGVAWRLYRSLTPRYAVWAKYRVAQGQAEGLSINDISGTEWPPFGSVFYLWAIENLQAAWEAGDHSMADEPSVFARDAIIAASELVIDPKHASWVKKHWGADYLHREDAFYRMLVIAALTTREKLLHDSAHMDMLRDQVDTFARELDSCKTGLLDDYPGQCFPGDVMAAVMCIKRADAVLGTDHTEFIARAVRGFTGINATRHRLPPYSASSRTGVPESQARGCANSYMCLTAPELWPEQARQWYAIYDEYFWQERITTVGYREYPKDVPHSDWTIDVDAGPVVAGHGVSANAFGVGAARKNGRFDRAYPLAAEMLATVGELPNGVLAVPRLLSDVSDAPLLGEAAILWLVTIQPEYGFPVRSGGRAPPYVYLVLIGALIFGAWRIVEAIRTFRQAGGPMEPDPPAPRFQIGAWVLFMLSAVVAFSAGRGLAGIVSLIIAVMLPIVKKRKPKDGGKSRSAQL
jgi:hypothetical protein